MRWVVVLALAACGGSDATTPDGSIDGAHDASLADGRGAPTADELLAKLVDCNVVGGNYATDDGEDETIPICSLTVGVFWKADLDVDCDGKTSAQCNIDTDPAYQDETSATDSHGDPLDAATLPFVVVPLPSIRFDYADGGLALGSVIAVIYDGKVEYGVFGDEGPSSIIGEASYAMASSLGIDPDPSTGGTDSGVAYIAFTGSDAVVPTIEDHAMAVAIGEARARALLDQP